MEYYDRNARRHPSRTDLTAQSMVELGMPLGPYQATGSVGGKGLRRYLWTDGNPHKGYTDSSPMRPYLGAITSWSVLP